MIARPAFIYAMVSGICLTLHNLVLILGDQIGWVLPLSILVSFCLSAITGYVLHSLFTFREPMHASNFFRYAVAMSANIPLALVAVWFWHVAVGLEMIWASPIATICMLGVNFILSRWAILSKSKQVS
ncbi:MAG: hypothetical protein A2885_20210 [Sphingopyxis sp. RIFCSPHIGHO2_01_FULL_65_24]|nr:MAG: hypothetical protein A2885_20210 [Sphingopyxis sp. RIFCSPHIGHO2_01_FULL_65_24]